MGALNLSYRGQCIQVRFRFLFWAGACLRDALQPDQVLNFRISSICVGREKKKDALLGSNSRLKKKVSQVLGGESLTKSDFL